MADDVRVSEWDLRASAGTTTSLQFTAPTALSSLSVYTGGTVTDVDDLTGATQYTGTLSSANLIATVDLVVPTTGQTPLRLVVNGAVQTVGVLIPTTSGASSPDNTITLTADSETYTLTVLGVAQRADAITELDGGDANSTYDGDGTVYTLARVQDRLLVESTDDLTPYLSGDEYVLPAGLVVIGGAVDLVDKALRLSTDTVLRGFADSSITSSVTGGVVRATNIGSHLVMREFSIIATGGPCLNLTGTISYQCNLFFLGLIGIGAGTSAGTITGFDVQAVKDCYVNAPNGLTFAGTTNKLFVDRSPFYGTTGSAITLDSTLAAQVADISTCFFKFDSPGVSLTAEAGYSVGEGKIRGSLIEGTATALSGISPADVEWTVRDNSGVRDSRIVGSAALNTTAETVISTVDTPVKVAGTTTAGLLNERFTHADNRLTYSGQSDVLLEIQATLAVDTGNNKLLNFYIAKNGSVVAESQSTVFVGSGTDLRQASVRLLAEAETGDYFEVWGENATDDTNFTCVTLQLQANA